MGWNDAVKFCEKLSQLAGHQYSLPSESQWEYACRAGTNTRFCFGEEITDDLVNCDNGGTTPVGSFSPNAFGLYDMHGNVWEWCLDVWHKNYNGAPTDGSAWIENGDLTELKCNMLELSDKSLSPSDMNYLHLRRGGSWYPHRPYCRSSSRNTTQHDFRNHYTGFRVVCNPLL